MNTRDEVMVRAGEILSPAWSGYTGNSRERYSFTAIPPGEYRDVTLHVQIVFLTIHFESQIIQSC